MRSRSRRTCAQMNAGDLGNRWAVCACAYDPNHVTAQGKRLGLICACVPLVPRFYAVLQNYAKYADPPLGWGHVIFMPIFGSFDVTLVTWALCLILIGREKFCCAVIG